MLEIYYLNRMRLPYYQYFQVIALLSCLIFYKDVRKQGIGAFLPLCILVCAVEIISANVKIWGISQSDHFLKNIYVIGSTPLYFYIFYRVLPLSVKIKKVYIMIASIVIACSIINYLFIQGPTNINILTLIFQQLVTILLSCTLLYFLSVEERYFVLWKEPSFWVAAGLLIFSLGTLVVLGLYQYIRMNQLTIQNRNLYSVLMPFLNIILYSSYTYAFYLCWQKKS